MSTGSVAEDSCTLTVLLEIRVYWQRCWRFMSSGDGAGDSRLLAVLLEIHVFWGATPC
jgi:hypothetical protein